MDVNSNTRTTMRNKVNINCGSPILSIGVLGLIVLYFLPWFVTIPAEHQAVYDLAFWICAILTGINIALFLVGLIIIFAIMMKRR